MNRTTVRRARKQHPCADMYCGTRIMPGDLYLEHVLAPNSDILDNEHWMRSKECRACAERYAREPWFLAYEARQTGWAAVPGMMVHGFDPIRYTVRTGQYLEPGFAKYDARLLVATSPQIFETVDSRTLYPVKVKS